MMPDWLKQVMEEGECCICGGPLKGSQINFVNLNKIVTWPFPVWGNILVVDEPWQRAMAILCDNCVDEEKGVIKGEVKRALEIRDGAPVYHDVDELEDPRHLKRTEVIRMLGIIRIPEAKKISFVDQIRKELADEWVRLHSIFKKETFDTYNDTVRKGNKQTYSEFAESLRKDWIEEMLVKRLKKRP